MLSFEKGPAYPYTVQPRLVDGETKYVVFNCMTSWQGRHWDTYEDAEEIALQMKEVIYGDQPVPAPKNADPTDT